PLVVERGHRYLNSGPTPDAIMPTAGPGMAYRTRPKRSCGGDALCECRKLGVQLPGGRAELRVAEALHERRRPIIAKPRAPIRAFVDNQTDGDVQSRTDIMQQHRGGDQGIADRILPHFWRAPHQPQEAAVVEG